MYLKLFEKKFKSDSSHQNIGKLYIYKYFRHARAFFRSFIASFLRLVTIYLHRIKEVSTYTHTSWEFTSASFLSGLFFLPWRNSPPPPPSGPGPPHYQGYMIALTHTTPGRAPLDEWSARRTDLYLTTHNTPPHVGIRTHNPGKRAGVDPRLRMRGHWDRTEDSSVMVNTERIFIIYRYV